jgi:hypothetical protein
VENNLLRYVKFPPDVHTCGRCHALNVATTMSLFDEQMLCPECREDETFAPNYDAARAAERAAVRWGNLRFPGVGLADDDRAILRDRLSARRRAAALEGGPPRSSPDTTRRAGGWPDGPSAPEPWAER